MKADVHAEGNQSIIETIFSSNHSVPQVSIFADLSHAWLRNLLGHVQLQEHAQPGHGLTPRSVTDRLSESSIRMLWTLKQLLDRRADQGPKNGSMGDTVK